MEIKENSREEMFNIIMNILKNGGEAVIRKRSKNGEKYIEIVEQNFKTTQKFSILKNE